MQEEQRHPIYERPIHLKHVIARVLVERVQSNEGINSLPECFNTQGKITISFFGYIDRMLLTNLGLFTLFNCSKINFIVALALIDKIQFLNPEFRITRKNIFRVLVAALVISIKGNDDFFSTNSQYAYFAGITLPLLNMLERTFLNMLNYNSLVLRPVFQEYLKNLEEYFEDHKEQILETVKKEE